MMRVLGRVGATLLLLAGGFEILVALVGLYDFDDASHLGSLTTAIIGSALIAAGVWFMGQVEIRPQDSPPFPGA
jgi:hypothetical protein